MKPKTRHLVIMSFLYLALRGLFELIALKYRSEDAKEVEIDNWTQRPNASVIRPGLSDQTLQGTFKPSRQLTTLTNLRFLKENHPDAWHEGRESVPTWADEARRHG